jgi:hypothetical protein
MKRTRRLLAGALTAAVLLVGCGGDDGGSSEPAATTAAPAASTTAAPSTTKAATTTAAVTTTKAATPSITEFCAKGSPALVQLSGMSGSNLPATPADMKKQFEQLGVVFADVQKIAPAELKADFEVLGKAFTGVIAVMTKYDYDVTKVLNDPEAMKAVQALSDPTFTKAAENIQAWLAKNCPAAK